jgi:hypothetical protein
MRNQHAEVGQVGASPEQVCAGSKFRNAHSMRILVTTRRWRARINLYS